MKGAKTYFKGMSRIYKTSLWNRGKEITEWEDSVHVHREGEKEDLRSE